MPRKTYTIEVRAEDYEDRDVVKEGVVIAANAIQRHFPNTRVVAFSDDFFEGHKDLTK